SQVDGNFTLDATSNTTPVSRFTNITFSGGISTTGFSQTQIDSGSVGYLKAGGSSVVTVGSEGASVEMLDGMSATDSAQVKISNAELDNDLSVDKQALVTVEGGTFHDINAAGDNFDEEEGSHGGIYVNGGTIFTDITAAKKALIVVSG